ADGGADGLRGARPTERVGDRAVGDGGAAGDLQELRPDGALEVGARRGERQRELLALAGEVLVQLLLGPVEEGMGSLGGVAHPLGGGAAQLALAPEAAQVLSVGGEHVAAQARDDQAVYRGAVVGSGGHGRSFRRVRRSAGRVSRWWKRCITA